MKLLIDFFPIILFFVAYKIYGIYVATVIAIAASLAQVTWLRLRHGRFETMPLVTLGLIAVFGGLTLALRDPIFVMWKPTIVDWLFAAVFLGTTLIGKRPAIERMMGQAIQVPEAVWRRLNWAWILFFLLLGLANLFVVYVASGFYGTQQALITATGISEIDLARCAEAFTGSQLALCEQARASESTWVNFKLFGMMGLTVLFVLGQAFYLARHIQDSETSQADEPASDARESAQHQALPEPQSTATRGETR
jgi:intracellular septation protein